MMSLYRLAEIRHFHAVLATRFKSDRTAITVLERQAVLSMMAELIDHAEKTVQR